MISAENYGTLRDIAVLLVFLIISFLQRQVTRCFHAERQFYERLFYGRLQVVERPLSVANGVVYVDLTLVCVHGGYGWLLLYLQLSSRTFHLVLNSV